MPRPEPFPSGFPGPLASGPLSGLPLPRGVALAGSFILQCLAARLRLFLPRGVTGDGLGLTDHSFGIGVRHERATLWSSWTAGRSGEFIKAREAARLPDDAGGFGVCGEVVA
jgi:hypothetical protein